MKRVLVVMVFLVGSLVLPTHATAHGVCTALAYKPIVNSGAVGVWGGEMRCDNSHNFIDWEGSTLQRRRSSSDPWVTELTIVGYGCNNCRTDLRPHASSFSGLDECAFQWRSIIKYNVSGHGPYTDNSAPGTC